MANYFFSKKAVEDLSEIWNYTYDAWSESRADKYYKLLIRFCKEIASNPKIGKSYEEIDKSIFGYRASHHIIFYRVIKAKEIEVVRILHVRMDLKNKIQEL